MSPFYSKKKIKSRLMLFQLQLLLCQGERVRGLLNRPFLLKKYLIVFIAFIVFEYSRNCHKSPQKSLYVQEPFNKYVTMEGEGCVYGFLDKPLKFRGGGGVRYVTAKEQFFQIIQIHNSSFKIPYTNKRYKTRISKISIGDNKDKFSILVDLISLPF